MGHIALILAGRDSRAIEREVRVARSLHLAWEAWEAKDLENASLHLRRVSSKLTRQAAKLDSYVAKKSRDLAAAKRDLAARVGEIGAMHAKSGDEIAEIAALIAGHRDSIVASLEGRWGTSEAHPAIEAVRIKGEEPAISNLLKNAKLFEIGVVDVLGRTRCKSKEIGLKFALPRSFDDGVNGAVGANGFLFEKNADGEWVQMTGSPMNKNHSATTGLYHLLDDAVNTRPEIKEHLSAMLLKRVGSTSPWHKPLSTGDFQTVPLGHKLGTLGVLLYQLAIVPDSMTPELQRTMAVITATMTKAAKPEADPSYFTVGAKRKATSEDDDSEEACGDSSPAAKSRAR
jgi:hypothetical protein